ncbi:hypothetical protein J3A83DRAFT_4097400 [Scleroderma citrinum]
MLPLPPPSPSKHSYGTRIRNNSVLRPSARLRQSTPPPNPTPRRIKPTPQHKQLPHNQDPPPSAFPLPNVMLHPEDASSKVFHAIGRSFLSVDNRAMTIKDLAEMALKFGLVCQNVSAASQAITTYIRNHLSRCEAQHDHPLLLRHVLSGTPADDELVPALYSRVGGAPSPNKSTERITNFRRGTMVWYLSKAAGVSCPFTRAGIRLCEYGKEGKQPPSTTGDDPLAFLIKSKRGHAQCGEKRKRLRRGYSVDGELSADSGDSDSEKEGERPPKVKLTLRLRPSATVVTSSPQLTEVIDLSQEPSSSEDEAVDDISDDTEMRLVPSDASWSLPPYPRRSIAVPCYTPTCDDHPRTLPSCPDTRRSPSVPCSASPPPDSDHDEHDIDIDIDAEADSDFDWDSSSICLTSPEITVKNVNIVGEHPEIKQEPQDVRDMLDLWEDLDCARTHPSTVSSATVKLPADDVKVEELELWEWEFENSWSGPHEDVNIADVKIPVSASESVPCPLSLHNFTPVCGFPESPCSSFAPSSPSVPSSVSPSSDVFAGSFSPPVHAVVSDTALTWQDTELLGPDSVHPEEFDEGWSDRGGGRRDPCFGSMRTSSRSPSRRMGSAPVDGRAPCSLRRDVGVNAINATLNIDVQPTSSPSHAMTPDVVIVHTCQPCAPSIIATQVEGISVYQTVLGSTPLLRRIDTDFVNLSTLLSHLHLPVPSSLSPACVSIVHRLPSVNGVWAPLSVARTFARGLPDGIKDVFLSGELVMRFPSALQDFHKKSTPGRMLNQFGPRFKSSLTSNGSPSSALSALESDHTEPVWEAPLDVALEEPVVVIPPSFDVALAALRPCIPTEDVSNLRETPLSPSEQELFRTLCVYPDWESEEVEVVDNESLTESCEARSREEKPLRRSRRVANAAARSRAVRLRTRGPRHS